MIHCISAEDFNATVSGMSAALGAIAAFLIWAFIRLGQLQRVVKGLQEKTKP